MALDYKEIQVEANREDVGLGKVQKQIRERTRVDGKARRSSDHARGGSNALGYAARDK
jgi:hypothetical protein